MAETLWAHIEGGLPTKVTNSSKVEGAIEDMVNKKYPQLSESERDAIAKEVKITDLSTRLAYGSSWYELPELNCLNTNMSEAFVAMVLLNYKLENMDQASMNKNLGIETINELKQRITQEEQDFLKAHFGERELDVKEGFEVLLERRLAKKYPEQVTKKEEGVKLMPASEYNNRHSQLYNDTRYSNAIPTPLPNQVASLNGVFEINENEHHLFKDGATKEHIVKLLRAIKHSPKAERDIGKTDLSKSMYIDLTRVNNLEQMIRMASAAYMKDNTGIDVGFENIRLPLVVHLNDIEYGHTDGSDSVEFKLATDRNAIMVVSKVVFGYRVEFYCVAKGSKAAILMDVFLIPDAGDACIPYEVVYKHNFPKASKEDIMRFSTFNQATVITIINMINHYHVAALGQPSKLKLRNVIPSLHPWHRPHVILPAPYRHTFGVNEEGFIYDAAKIMETFMSTLENEDGFYNDTIPFIMPFSENKVAFTPLIFQYLPFQKFTVVDEHFLPTDGGRFYLSYNNADIRIGMCGGNDFTFEIAKLTSSDFGKDSEGNLVIKKFEIVESTNGKISDEDYRKELERHIRMLASNLAAFLIHYSNLEPMYHTDPTHDNKRQLHRDLSKEVERIANRVSVVKLAHPRKLRYAGHLGGTHASPVEHERRGHWRSYKSGKRTWVADTTVNKGKGDKLKKVYVLEGV